MDKPRFSKSIERHFCYRAYIDDSGEILETQDFKTLWRVTRSHLKTNVRYMEDSYKSSTAKLVFGYETAYEIRTGYWYVEWTPINEYGRYMAYTDCEWYYRFADDCNIRIS